jgi:hypothetical protein
VARQAVAPDPEELGYALLMLIDGANARVVVAGDRTAMRRAGAAAARLIGRFDDHDTEPATERRTM